MKYSKDKIIGFAKQYFESSKLEKIYATEDNNFFFVEHKSYADAHSNANGLELFEITRNDVFPVEVKETPEPQKEEPQVKKTKKNKK